MNPETRLERRWRPAFTLVELMVSMALLSVLLLAIAAMTDSARRTWFYTNSKVEEFRGAREAFETITRRLSQATLNTYWDYQYPGGDTTKAPTAYVRQSELRFISDNAGNLIGSANIHPTHAVFFQAPLGMTSNLSDQSLETLLNTCGYYVEFNDDSQSSPPFVKASPRYRFRLMELVEPSESFSLYNYEVQTSPSNPADGYTGHDWFTDPIAKSDQRVLADNVVALIILPKLTPADQTANGQSYTDASLAPHYSYDSTNTAVTDPNLDPHNQLPPVVQVTLVAVDDVSFARQQTTTVPPDLFSSSPFSDANNYASDLQALENALQSRKINYRVFTTNVAIRAAKWSRSEQH